MLNEEDNTMPLLGQKTRGLLGRFLNYIQNRRKAKFFLRNSKSSSVFHFIHIGRCAGTVIQKRFQEEFKYEQISKHSIKITTEKCEIWFHSHKISLKMIPIGHKVFFVVRNPIERFISGFNRRLIRGSPSSMKNLKFTLLKDKSGSNNWSSEEKLVFTKYGSVLEFVESLFSANKAIRRESLKNLKKIKHLGIFGSYWDYLGNKKYLESRKEDILLVLRLENLDADFSKLLNLLGISNTFKLPPLGAEANSNPTKTDINLLSPRLIKKMEQFLQKEFLFLDFCKENNFFR